MRSNKQKKSNLIISHRLQNDVARLERKLCESQIENRNLKTNFDSINTSYAYEYVSDTDSEHTIDNMMKKLMKRRSHTWNYVESIQ